MGCAASTSGSPVGKERGSRPGGPGPKHGEDDLTGHASSNSNRDSKFELELADKLEDCLRRNSNWNTDSTWQSTFGSVIGYGHPWLNTIREGSCENSKWSTFDISRTTSAGANRSNSQVRVRRHSRSEGSR